MLTHFYRVLLVTTISKLESLAQMRNDRNLQRDWSKSHPFQLASILEWTKRKTKKIVDVKHPVVAIYNYKFYLKVFA